MEQSAVESIRSKLRRELDIEQQARLQAYYWDPVENDHQCLTFYADDEARKEKKILYEKYNYKTLRGWFTFKTNSGIEANILGKSNYYKSRR